MRGTRSRGKLPKTITVTVAKFREMALDERIEAAGAATAATDADAAAECPICMAPLESACRTPCGHTFCAECLTRSFPAETPAAAGSCPLCRRAISLYSTVSVESALPLRVPAVATIFGSTYLQGGKPGVAAYHFDAEADCYISYEHAPPGWRLDDGSSPPAKKPFLNPKYDPATRTFTGTIEWSEATINGGDARWEYTMIFSESLEIIAGGGSRRLGADGAERGANDFVDSLVYWRQPGAAAPTTLSGLCFVQGGSVGLASYHFVGEGAADASYISYEHAPADWALDDGTRPPSRKPFLSPSYDAATRTFTAAVDWSPTSFGGDARWAYTMVFDETLEAIVGGQVQSFKADGSEGAPIPFGDAQRPASALARLFGRGLSPGLEYERLVAGRAEMLHLLRSRTRSAPRAPRRPERLPPRRRTTEEQGE